MIRLREIREAKRLDQAELARISGVSQSAISSIERGARKNPGILTLEALARGLCCQLSDIYQPDEPAA